MALIFIDGFDHYATADITKKWTSASSASISATAGRRGGGAMVIGLNTAVATKAFNAAQTVIVGVAFYVSSLGAVVLRLLDGATTQIQLSTNADGSLSVYRGAGTTLLGATAAGVVSAGTYAYLELKVKIDPSAGTVDLRVNAASKLSLTAQNTRASSNSSANTLQLITGSSAASWYYDDLYLCDGTGTANNDFLGDVRVDTVLPNADGSYSAFTPDAGTVHYSRVNEAAPDTATYNADSTVGDRDSYGLADVTALVSSTIFGVQVNAAAQKDDAGARSVATFIRSGGSNKDGAGAALGTAQAYVSQVFETDAAGAAFTQTSVNALEAGVVITA